MLFWMLLMHKNRKAWKTIILRRPSEHRDMNFSGTESDKRKKQLKLSTTSKEIILKADKKLFQNDDIESAQVWVREQYYLIHWALSHDL